MHGLDHGSLVVGPPQRARWLPQGAGQLEVGLGRTRVDQDARVEDPQRVTDGLGVSEEVQHLGDVHRAQQRRAGTAVAVLTGEGAAVGRDEHGRLVEEASERGRTVALPQTEVDPHVDAAVAEVAVGHTVEAVPGEQRLEVAQVGAQAIRRNGRVLPAGVGGAGQAPCGQPGAVLPDPPQRGLLDDVGDDPVVQGRRIGGDTLRERTRFRLGVGRDLGEEPAAAARQHRDAAVPVADHADDAVVEAFAGDQWVPEDPRHGVGGVGHRGIAEHGEGAPGRVAHEPDGRAKDDGERALAAHQEPIEPATVLGEQLLEGVAGDLAGEPAEAGPDQAQVVGDQPVQGVPA